MQKQIEDHRSGIRGGAYHLPVFADSLTQMYNIFLFRDSVVNDFKVMWNEWRKGKC